MNHILIIHLKFKCLMDVLHFTQNPNLFLPIVLPTEENWHLTQRKLNKLVIPFNINLLGFNNYNK